MIKLLQRASQDIKKARHAIGRTLSSRDAVLRHSEVADDHHRRRTLKCDTLAYVAEEAVVMVIMDNIAFQMSLHVIFYSIAPPA